MGAHNAYLKDHHPLDPNAFIEHVEELYSFGVRGLELDLVQDPAAFEWSVGHSDLHYSSAPADQFSAFLGALAAWSGSHADHDLVVVHLEPKSGADPGFPEEFDGYILRAFDPSLLVRPGDLMTAADASIGEAIAARGWPLLDVMRGRFLFCLSGESSATQRYASTAPRRRLCFADRGISQTPGDPAPFRDSIRPFLNIQKSGTVWKSILAEEVTAQPWILPRLWGAKNALDFDDLAGRGVWMVAVNDPAGADADEPYRTRSSGTQSRAGAVATRKRAKSGSARRPKAAATRARTKPRRANRGRTKAGRAKSSKSTRPARSGRSRRKPARSRSRG